MPLPEVFERIWLENEDSVRARLLAAIPEKWATVEGSFSRDMIEVDVLEFTRMWEELNRYLSYMFIQYAYGSLLDAHGQSYGLPRGAGSEATGLVRFTAPVGTAIPAGTLVGVPTTDPDEPRAIYKTTNVTSAIVPAAGYVEVPIISLEKGAAQNQAAGSVTLLQSPNGAGGVLLEIESITNLAPITGGTDPETDDEYRTKLLGAAELPVGSGTLADYREWALEKPGVSDVAVQGLWDTSGETPGLFNGRQNGSVLITVRGPTFVAVDWQDLQEVQDYIDPSRQTVAMLSDGEPWTLTAEEHSTLGFETTSVQWGASALEIVSSAADTAVFSLVRTMDLERFAGPPPENQLEKASRFYLWVKSSNWANVANTSVLRFYTDEGDYYEIAMKTIAGSEPATAKPTGGSEWWLWNFEMGQCTKVGTPDWSNITKVEIHQVTTGAATQFYDYFTIRDPIGAVGEGRAPVGAAVTVVTPLPLTLNISMDVTPIAGYSASGAPGTSNLTELLTATINAYFRSLKPGEPLLISKLESVISNTPGVADFVLDEPGGVTTVSEEVTLPAATVKVVSTAGFLPAGSFFVNNQQVFYTGLTSTSFTGCTGGAGKQVVDSVVKQTIVPISMHQYVTLGELSLS